MSPSRVGREVIAEKSRDVDVPLAPSAHGRASPLGPVGSSRTVRRWSQLGRYLRGPALAAIVVVASILVSAAIALPSLMLVYLLVIIAIAVVEGSRSGLASGIILSAYVAYAEVRPTRVVAVSGRDTAVQVFVFAIVALVTAGLAGAGSRRAERLHGELLAERQRLSEALESKNEFMNAAAHELRTPLTVIAGYVSMLQDETFGRLPERFRDPIAAMQRKAREVAALIDQLLLAARVQRGTAPAARVAVDVRGAVRKAVEAAEPRVTLERATLTYEVPSAAVEADIDPDHLAHILDNLISNALTYSDERPWVKVTVTGGRDARVLVRDRGWGIPDAMRHKIFEGFVHDVNPDYEPKRGKGLGLSISRELAERYGGSLDLVRTEPGKGSLFVLRLPRVSS